jgi:hypothetical protein
MFQERLNALGVRHLWRLAHRVGMRGDFARTLNPKSVGVERIEQQLFAGAYTLEQLERCIAETASITDPTPVAQAVTAAVADPVAAALEALQTALSSKGSSGGLTEDQVTALVLDLLDKRNARPITVESPRATVTLTERLHSIFEDVLMCVTTRNNSGERLSPWVWGPAGSGKSTLGKQIAKSLDLPFYSTSAVQSKYDLMGFVSPNGDPESLMTPFRRAYEFGGVFLFDDIDRSSANAFSAFNQALANGICAFPDKVVKRHADTAIIATANTPGSGGTSQYSGAQRQDGATLDRFRRIRCDYDEALEVDMAGDQRDWALFVQAVRRSVAAQGLQILVTPRATEDGAALLRNGVSRSKVEQWCLFDGLDQSTVDRIRMGVSA